MNILLNVFLLFTYNYFYEHEKLTWGKVTNIEIYNIYYAENI